MEKQNAPINPMNGSMVGTAMASRTAQRLSHIISSIYNNSKNSKNKMSLNAYLHRIPAPSS